MRVAMEFTGERYVPSITGEIYYEHVHRYAIAAPACAGKRVLDLASGEGWGSALLARHAAEVVGIDIDAASTEHARRAYYLANLRFVTGSATEIPLGDASVDVITSFETIEHLNDHDRMLGEFKRTLVPDGTLFISSPNKLVYSDLANYENPFHVRELYYQEFRDLLKRYFTNVEIYGQRFINSSVLHPLSGARNGAAGWFAGDLSEIGDGLPTFSTPVYFVAVCSDGPLYDRVASGFVDPRDDLYSHLRQELEMLRYRVSTDRAISAAEDSTLAMTTLRQPAIEGALEPAGDSRDRVGELAAGLEERETEFAARVRQFDEERVAWQARADEFAGVLEEREAVFARARQLEEELLAAQRSHEEVLQVERSRVEAGERRQVDLVAEHNAALAAERELRTRLESEIGVLAAARDERYRIAESDIASLQTELASANAARAAITANLNATTDSQRDLDSRIVELAQVVRVLTERERELAKTIAEQDAALAAHNQRTGELKRVLAERDADLDRREAVIVERDATLAEYDAMLRERAAAVSDRDARIAELEGGLGKRITQIAALQTMVAERDAMEGRIVELQVRLSEEAAATAAFRERAERDGALLRDILNSRSWRMTTLLRRAARVVRGRRDV